MWFWREKFSEKDFPQVSQICSVFVKWLAVWVLTSTFGTNSLQMEHFKRTMRVFSLSWLSVILPLQYQNINTKTSKYKIVNILSCCCLLCPDCPHPQHTAFIANNNTGFVMFLFSWFLTRSSSSWAQDFRNFSILFPLFYHFLYLLRDAITEPFTMSSLLSFSTEYTAHKICLGLEDDNSSLSHSTCQQDDAKGRAGRERF